MNPQQNSPFTERMSESETESLFFYPSRLASAVSLIKKSQRISKPDKGRLLDFLDHLEAQRVSMGRRAKYAYHLKTIAEQFFPSHLDIARRADVEKFMRWLNNQNY